MRLNVKKFYAKVTAEGGAAFPHLTPLQSLRRTVLSCLLWERSFYEDGKSIVERIKEASEQVSAQQLATLAIEARKLHNLRHVPLLLLAILCRKGSGSRLVSDTIYNVISRADELTEFMAVYAEVNGVTPDKVKKKLSAQAKLGLARAFTKFDEYQLAKYDRDGVVKLRDVLFLCHAAGGNEERNALYKRLIEGTLQTPDTWEVELSAGKDKKETFERLIQENKLGFFALLRNLRNMQQAGVDRNIIETAFSTAKGKERILPFRYVAAARAAPQFEPLLDKAMQSSIAALPVLKGQTIVLVDISPSMDEKLSSKSDLTRLEAATALSGIVNAENLRVFAFSNTVVEVPPRRGMAAMDAVSKAPIARNGTLLGSAIQAMNALPHDRLIVVTDEQSQDNVGDPVAKHAYMINVATEKNGVGYGRWTHIDGFSENVLKYIAEIEGEKHG